MDSKKRFRGDEGSELDPSDAKRFKAANGQALHKVPAPTAKASSLVSSKAIDELLMDMDDSEMLPVEVIPKATSSSSTFRQVALTSTTVSTAKSRPSKSAIEELLDGLGDDEGDTEQFSVSQVNERPAPSQVISSPPTYNFVAPTSTSLFSKATRLTPLHAPSAPTLHPSDSTSAQQATPATDALHSVAQEESTAVEPLQLFQTASTTFVTPAVSEATPATSEASIPSTNAITESLTSMEAFEAILAAGRAKQDQRATRQLHTPAVPSLSSMIVIESATSKSKATNEPQQHQDAALSSVLAADHGEDEFERALANIKAKTAAPRTFNAPVRNPIEPRANHLGTPSRAPPSSSLFQSARSIPSTDVMPESSSESTSLFHTVSRETNGSPAPLFSSARVIQSEDSATSKPSSSLFSSTKSLNSTEEAPNASLFQTASRERSSPSPSSSLFSSAKTIHNEDSSSASLFSSVKTLHRADETPNGSLFQTASRELSSPSPSTSLFSSAKAIRNEESSGTSLFSSARSIQNESSESLFQVASRELPTPASSSLFSSARNDLAASSPSTGSLFSSARNLPSESNSGTGSLFQAASRDLASNGTSNSLFSSARNLQDDDSAPNKPAEEYASASAAVGDEDDFERYLSNLGAKKSAPTFSAPRALNPAPVDEEDEFEAFLKTVSKRSAAVPAPASAKKTGSSTTYASKAASALATAPNPRKFKAPAVISPAANRSSTSKVAEDKQNADDDIQDALLSLLEGDDSDDEESAPQSTPEPTLSLNSLPRSPVVLRGHTRPMPAPTSVRQTLHEPTSVEPIPSVESPLPTESYADLLDGLESEEMTFNPPSTPQASNASRRFYASPSSKTPSTPTSSGSSRPGISNRGVVRSSPYSLTSPNAMPVVISTPNKPVEVRSPSRLHRASPSPVVSSAPSNKRARAPFTSPTRMEDGDEGEDNLTKRSKQVVYGRTTVEDTPKKPIKRIENHLFNLNPIDEQLATRKPWSEIGRAPHGFSRHQLLAYKLRPQVIDMTSDSAKTFKFSQMDVDGEMKQLGAEDMFEVLLSEGASRKVLTLPWVQNHFRWIVWKLASVERSFPQEFANAYLTPERVLAQLKYRYERELNCAQRPPLRKILEHDAPAAVHTVFMVTAVRHDGTADKSVRVTGDEGPQHYDEEEESNRIVKGPLAILELSDGWYSVHALCDPYLTRQVQDGAIFAGQKLHVFGASIIGNDNPTPPLEVTASTMLKLSINGVRRAKWDDKLGFSRVPLPSLRLSSLKPGGGNAPKIDAIILRVYPLTFSEEVIVTPTEDAPKGPDGEASPVMRVMRTPFGEDIALERFIKKKEDWIEKKTRELTMEILEESKSNGVKASARMEVDDDPNQASNGGTSHYYDESYLTNSQREKLEERLREAMEVELWLDRQVTPVLKLLICDYPGTKGPAFEVIEYLKEHGADGLMTLTAAQNKALHSLGKAMLTVYNVTEDALARFKEGTRIQASFISYKGEPFVPPRPLPNLSLNAQSDSNPNGFTNITSADDPFALSDSATEVVVAPLPRLSTTVYTVFNFPTTTRSRPTEDSLSLMEPKAQNGDSVVKTLNALFGRVATPFDALDARLKLKDVPVPENTWDLDALLDYERRRLVDRFTIANEFDGVGVVVFAGKKEIIKKCKYAQEEDLNALKDEYQLDIFLGDPSGNLLALRAESILDNLPPAAFEIGAIVCFKNVVYNGFDSHVGVHSASSTEYTEWITKAPSATANPSLKQKRDALLEWTHTNDFVETMELLSSRIIDIRTNRATRALPIANASSAIFIKS